jgi:hypothetical protein
MFNSRFMPCPGCGESVDPERTPQHQCRDERGVDDQFQDEVDRFEVELRRHLDSTAGRFEKWYAARQVRAAG